VIHLNIYPKTKENILKRQKWSYTVIVYILLVMRIEFPSK